MKIRKRNFIGETRNQVTERRISALEDHIQELSLTVSKLYAAVNRETEERLTNEYGQTKR